ncbi:MAG: 3D-(3,5/4)-trihydroxycyclohexane-1,2-dione acylhydrolase (decyclizing), partial [Rickettsiales bacterium]
MAKTIRLTMAQALVKYLTAQMVEIDGKEVPYFAGAWAIFGHGNVAGLGEALYQVREELPTYRAHNEQGMAHAAIGFGKATKRQRAMIATSSIGPGATNMITAAALAHVNRLPVLFLPGDVFVRRTPDPVLQQVENFADPTISANDCFRPVSRYFDRISRPEQIITSLPQAMATLLDAADCGPVTLSLPQDVQGEAFDYPKEFFAKKLHHLHRAEPDVRALAQAAEALKSAKKPLIVAGGGVHYSQGFDALRSFAETHQIPVCETQGGKASLPHRHGLQLGGLGVTGSDAANAVAAEADVILAVGTRLGDFATGSRTLMNDATIIGLNAARFDAIKHNALPLRADAKQGLKALSSALNGWKSDEKWVKNALNNAEKWQKTSADYTKNHERERPSDAEVVGAVARQEKMLGEVTVVAAAGSFPAELERHWPPSDPDSYHVEYGYSCMGYEIAGAIGAKMATPNREVIVFVGDGSYLMLNS